MAKFFGDNSPQPPPNDDTLYDVCVRQERIIPTSVVQCDMTLCDNHYGITSANLLKATEEFTNNAWIRFRSGTANADKLISDNVAEDPLGGMTAARYHIKNNLGTAQTSGVLVLQNYAGSIKGLSYAHSIWLRADQPTIMELGHMNNKSEGVNNSKRWVVTREWQRFTETFISDFTGLRGFWLLWRADATVGVTAGTVHDNALYLWGAQMEQGAYATTYTRNAGATSGAITSRCKAFDAGDGKRCFFTWSTCQDKVNNKVDGDGPNAGLRSYYFMPHNRPVPTRAEEIIHPYIQKIGVAQQKIDPKKAVTRTDRMLVTLVDDHEPPLFDLDKMPGVINTTTAGSFGRLFLERHRNYVDRAMTIKEGFVDNRATTRKRFNLGGDV